MRRARCACDSDSGRGMGIFEVATSGWFCGLKEWMAVEYCAKRRFDDWVIIIALFD